MPDSLQGNESGRADSFSVESRAVFANSPDVGLNFFRFESVLQKLWRKFDWLKNVVDFSAFYTFKVQMI